MTISTDDFKDEGVTSEKWLLFCIVLIAATLRVFHLGQPSLWTDEILTAGRIYLNFRDIIFSLGGEYPFPPLFYLLVKLSTLIFGVNEFALRFPSLVFSVLAVPVVHAFARMHFGARTGLISAFLYAISTYNINYAQEAKMYALLWFLAVMSFYLLSSWLKTQNDKWLCSYAVIMIASLYTSYLSLIFWGLQNGYCILYCDKSRKSRLWPWLKAQMLIVLLFVPWIEHAWFQIIHHKGIDWIPPVSGLPAYWHFLSRTLLSNLNILPWLWELDIYQRTSMPIENMLMGILYLFLVSTFCANNISLCRQKTLHEKLNIGFVLLLWWPIGTLGIFIVTNIAYHPIFVQRYFGLIGVPLYIAVGAGMAHFRVHIRIISLVGIVFCTISTSLLPYYEFDAKINGENWKAVGSLIASKQGCVNSVVVLPADSLENVGREFADLFRSGLRQYNSCISDVVSEQMISVGVSPLANHTTYYVVAHSESAVAPYWRGLRRVELYTFPYLWLGQYQ